MNGIEKIKARIEADAQTEIDRVLNEARNAAQEIRGRYEAQAKAEAAELTAKNERGAAEREERLVSMAQMEARKIVLSAKQEMVEKAYAQALDKLCSMPEEQYAAVLADLLAKACSTGKEEAIFSPEDQGAGRIAVEAVNKTFGRSLTISKETRPIKGGFILQDEHVEINCTFETLVRLQKADTAGEVAKMLFA